MNILRDFSYFAALREKHIDWVESVAPQEVLHHDCVVCGKHWRNVRGSGTRIYDPVCNECSIKASKEKTAKRLKESGARRAIAAVHVAVAAGKLPPASSRICVDCGNPAKHYDHRDYNRPLDVQPVCRSCNARRGPAIPLSRAA